MPKRDHQPEAYLADMLREAEYIQRFTSGVSKEEYANDIKTQHAVERCFEIIGEAAGRVDEATRARFPGIPFKKIKGMRDLMIHDYDNIKTDVLWDTIQNDLPVLIRSFGPAVERQLQQERLMDEGTSD